MTEKCKKIESFEDLLVWQKGMEVVKQIYLISREGELCRDFALRDQLRRAFFRQQHLHGKLVIVNPFLVQCFIKTFTECI